MSTFRDWLIKQSKSRVRMVLEAAAHHAAHAGNNDELEGMLTNYDYLSIKADKYGIQEVIADFNLIDIPEIRENGEHSAEVDAALRLIRKALVQIQNLVEDDLAQLPGQLLAKLCAESDFLIVIFCTDIRESVIHPWLAPITTGDNNIRQPVERIFDIKQLITAANISGDGQWAAAASSQYISIWDLETGQQEWHFKVEPIAGWSWSRMRYEDCEKYSVSISALALSFSGRWMIAGGYAKEYSGKQSVIGIWDTTSGERIHHVALNDCIVTSLAISQDGLVTIMGFEEQGGFRIWLPGQQTVDGQPLIRSLSSIKPFDKMRAIEELSLSRNGCIAIIRSEFYFYIWDIVASDVSSFSRSNIEGPVAFTSDNQILSLDKNILKVWSHQFGELALDLEALKQRIFPSAQNFLGYGDPAVKYKHFRWSLPIRQTSKKSLDLKRLETLNVISSDGRWGLLIKDTILSTVNLLREDSTTSSNKRQKHEYSWQGWERIIALSVDGKWIIVNYANQLVAWNILDSAKKPLILRKEDSLREVHQYSIFSITLHGEWLLLVTDQGQYSIVDRRLDIDKKLASSQKSQWCLRHISNDGYWGIWQSTNLDVGITNFKKKEVLDPLQNFSTVLGCECFSPPRHDSLSAEQRAAFSLLSKLQGNSSKNTHPETGAFVVDNSKYVVFVTRLTKAVSDWLFRHVKHQMVSNYANRRSGTDIFIVWNTETGDISEINIPELTWVVSYVAPASSSSCLLFCQSDLIVAYDLVQKEVISTHTLTSALIKVTLDVEGCWFVYSTEDRIIHVRHIELEKDVTMFRTENIVYDIRVNRLSDQKLLITTVDSNNNLYAFTFLIPVD